MNPISRRTVLRACLAAAELGVLAACSPNTTLHCHNIHHAEAGMAAVLGYTK